MRPADCRRLASHLRVAVLMGLPLLANSAAIAAAPTQPSGSSAPLFADPMVELLPGGEVMGDGSTPVALNLLILNTDGSPMSGVTVRAIPTAGKSGKCEEVHAGLYRCNWVPPLVDAAGSVAINFRGRTADKRNFNKRWNLPVVAPVPTGIQITSSPTQVVLGQDTSSTLTITVPGVSGQAANDLDLVVRASSGTVTNLTPLGNGQFTALYTPPAQMFPHVALITVADRHDPGRSYGAFALSLVGKTQFPVVGLPNSRVLVKVGDREFGPIQADGAGRARVPIVVPPGKRDATVISILNGQRTEEPLDLKIPPATRVSLFPLPQTVPADPNLTIPVRALVTMPDATPDATAQVRFTATAGTVSKAAYEGNGIYRATYSPPYGNTPAQATIQVVLDGARGKQSDAIPIDLVPARPAKLTVTTEPAKLLADTASLKVFAHMVGQDGAGVANQKLSITASGAILETPIRDLGGGDYQGIMSTVGNGPVELLASVQSPASHNPLHRVLVLPARQRIPNDGLSSTLLTILTVDRFGYPVAHVPVSLQLIQGDGSLPNNATTDASGLAQVYYTAGRQPGLVNIQVSAGYHVGGVGLIQLPEGVAPGLPDLPPSASNEIVDLMNAWKNVVRTLRVEREGMSGAPVEPIAQLKAGPIHKISVSATPATIAPGGSVTLKVLATDADGRGTGGQNLQFITSAGTVGPVQDLGGGAYQTKLQVPVGLAGEVKVSVTSPDGSVSGFLKIPVEGAQSWQTVAATPTNTRQAANQQTAEVGATSTTVAASPANSVTRKATPPSEHPWLQFQLGYMGGELSYQQRSLSSAGPLYRGTVTIGGSAGTPADASGGGVSARAWIPNLDYVGIEVGIQGMRYEVVLPGFENQPITDWWDSYRILGLARYPFEVGRNRFHVGARLGASLGDFLILRQLDALRTQYEPKLIGTLDLGAEVGAEIGKSAFGSAGLTWGTLGANKMKADVQVAFQPFGPAYVYAGGGFTNRDTTLYCQDCGSSGSVGTVADGVTHFDVGIGIRK